MEQGLIVMPPGVERPEYTHAALAEMPCPEAERQYAATRDTVAQWRNETRDRQQWRRDSATAIEYWDGNQFPPDLARKFRERGLPMIVHNCIKRWINSVVGMLERNQTDGVVRIEDPRLQALELALSQHLKEAERMTGADRACLNAMDYAIKGGIGWVEVGEHSDPFRYPDRVEDLPWREMDWDTSALRADLDDAQWFRRLKKYPRSVLMRAFPDKASLIHMAGGETDMVSWYEPEILERDVNSWRDTSRWIGLGRQQRELVSVSEFRYRVMVDGYVVMTQGGPVIFDEKNEEHLQAYYAGLVEPMPATYRRVRQSFWLGPYCLLDRWNPRPDHDIGWVPFICYIEDQTGAPYGLIRDMMTLQDEINATKGKMHWSMDSATIIGDKDRVEDWDDAREAVNRRDGIIVLQKSQNPNAEFKIDRHGGITQWQLEAYRDATAKIGYVHGLEAPVAGGRSSSDQSGVSQQIQIDQSVTSLGRPMANYRESRRRVLDLLLNQRIAKLSAGGAEELRYKDRDGSKKAVQVNVPVQLEDGTEETLTLSKLKRTTVLDDTPSTPTYRSQQFLQIIDTLRSMPEDAQRLLIPAMFEMSDLPNRDMYADLARKMLGMGGDKTPEEEADEQRAKQMQRLMEEMTVALAEAKALNEQAKARKTQAETVAIEQDVKHQEMTVAAGGPPKAGERSVNFRW